MKILSKRKKAFIPISIILLFLLVSLFGIHFYFNLMDRYNGALNINKINDVDKVYTSNIYSDFYFRAIEYRRVIIKENTFNIPLIGDLMAEEKKSIRETSYYSSLLPQKVSLGYNFKAHDEPRFIINPINITKGKMIEQNKDVDSYLQYIEIMEKFSKDYAIINATQDQDYFDKVYAETKKVFKDIYGVEVNISRVNKDDYYTEVPIIINNLKIKHFKLSNFVLKNKLDKKKWQPTIASWKWGDAEIYLEYFNRLKNNDKKKLNDLAKNWDQYVKIRTLKINNNIVDNLTLILSGSEVMAFFVSKDGYVYTLIMKAKSLTSLKTSMRDFLKIAYGIYFTNEATDTWFMMEQKEAEKYYYKCIDIENRIYDLEQKLGKSFHVKHFYPKRWDQKFIKFKSYYGSYPNSSVLLKLKKKLYELEKEDSN